MLFQKRVKPVMQNITGPMRTACLAVLGMLCLTGWMPGRATTLQQLSLAEMIDQSTAIVRGRVGNSTGVLHGSNIYTHYNVQVIETLKSTPKTPTSGTIEVAVPGGSVNGLQQSVAGAPVLESGSEYVLFLWTSSKGTTLVIGLTQGLFHLTQDAAGTPVLDRPANTEMMLDGQGRVVQDGAAHMSLDALRNRIRQQQGAAK